MPLTWATPWSAAKLLRELRAERDGLSIKVNTLLASNEAATLASQAISAANDDLMEENRNLRAHVADLGRDVRGRTDLHAAAVVELERQASAFAGQRAAMEKAASDHELRCAVVTFQNATLREDLDRVERHGRGLQRSLDEVRQRARDLEAWINIAPQDVERLTAADRERKRLSLEVDRLQNALQRDVDLWAQSWAADDSVLMRAEASLRATLDDLQASPGRPPGPAADHGRL